MLLLLFSASAARAGGELVDIKKLKAYERDLVSVYPQTVCLLDNLLGKENYTKLKKYDFFTGSTESDYDFKGGDDYLISFRQYYRSEDNRILYISDSGRLILGLRDKNKLIIYSNDMAMKHNPPAEVKEWIEKEYVSPLHISWHVPSNKKINFPAACSQNAMASEMIAYENAKKLAKCDMNVLKYLIFDSDPYTVSAEKNRVPLLSSKPISSANTEGRYLVSGDLVLLAMGDNPDGYACAYYRSKAGKENVGWVLLSDFYELKDRGRDFLDKLMLSLPKLSAKAWPNIAELSYPGIDFYNPEYNTEYPGLFTLEYDSVNARVAKLLDVVFAPEKTDYYLDSALKAMNTVLGAHIIRNTTDYNLYKLKEELTSAIKGAGISSLDKLSSFVDRFINVAKKTGMEFDSNDLLVLHRGFSYFRFNVSGLDEKTLIDSPFSGRFLSSRILQNDEEDVTIASAYLYEPIPLM